MCNSKKCIVQSNLHGSSCSLTQCKVLSADQFAAVELGSFIPALSLDPTAELMGCVALVSL